jgi:hypothetical protein
VQQGEFGASPVQELLYQSPTSKEVGTMVVDHDTWPRAGRLGFCSRGEYDGCYALVTAEIEDYWLVYVACPSEFSGDKIRSDDFTTRGDEQIRAILDETGIQWIPIDDEDELEERVFGLEVIGAPAD